MNNLNIDDFKKVEMVLGEILTAEKVPETDKLLKLTVNLGSKEDLEGESKDDIRQIISGISLYFPDPQVLVGKRCMFVANLEPRVIKGYESQGMILAITSKDGKFSLLVPETDISAGAKAR